MTNARDKANIPVLNFQSKGIDDNADATAITINSSEQVGIGTSSIDGKLHLDDGTSTKLIIEKDGGGFASLTFHNDGTSTSYIQLDASENMVHYGGSGVNQIFYASASERMRLTSTGLGIGTSSPSQKLEVSGSSNNIIKSKTTASSAIGGFEAWNNASAYMKVFSYGSSASGSNFGGVANANIALFEGQGVSNVVFSTWSNAGGSNPDFIFAPQRSQKVIIKSDGKVGIGTSSPSNILEIAGTGTPININSTNDEVKKIQFENSGVIQGYYGCSSGTPMRILNGSATELMRIDSSGNLGIGTTSPGSYKLSIQDSGTCLLKFRGGSGNGLYQQFEVNNGATTIGYLGDGANLISGGSQTDMCLRGTNNIKFAIANFQKTTINSSGLNVHGALSKSSGSFKIDHPLSSKTNTHHLVHSFVEAPQADNIYRGKVDLVSGTATVNIDTVAGMSEGTFILLNREIQCFTSNETGWIAVKGSVSGNTLTITAQDNTCNDTISWMVIGERQDQHMYDTDWTDENGKVIVEPLKETEQQQP